jgi:hypothetical protein
MAAKNKETTGRTIWDAILVILNNRKLLVLFLLIASIGSFIYFKLYHVSAAPSAQNINQCPTWSLEGRLVTSDGKYINAKGITIGVHDGPFKTDENIMNGVFRITGFTTPQDQFIQLYMDVGNKHYLFYRKPLDPTKQKIDSNLCVITFLENIRISDEINESLKKQDKKTAPASISFSGDSYIDLENRFLKKGYSVKSSNPSFKIKIAYSGSLEKINNSDLWRYSGGYLEVTVNDVKCPDLKEIRIESTFEKGNSLDFVETNLRAQLKDSVSKNAEDIFQTILSCIQ